MLAEWVESLVSR